MSRARNLIETAINLEVEDLAADFVETEIGRFFFTSSWGRRKDAIIAQLRTFLDLKGVPEVEGEVVQLLDQWAGEKSNWSDRWNDDYAGGERPAWKKPPKPKKKKDGPHRQV